MSQLASARLRPALGRLRRRWETGPDRRRSVRLLLDAVHGLTPTAALPHPERCRVRQVLPGGTDITVVLLGDPETTQPFIARIASGGNDGAGITRNHEALNGLAGDKRVAHLQRWFPTQLFLGSAAGRVFALEDALAGQRASRLVGRESLTCLRGRALASINQVHEATGATRVAGEDLLRAVLDGPLQALRAAHPALLSDSDASASRLRGRVRDFVLGQPLHIGWTHGDFWLGNVMMEPGEPAIRGIVDWDAARREGFAGMDLYHLLLTARVDAERRELGSVVCDLLHSQRWTDEEAEQLAGATEPLCTTSEIRPELLLLTWLNHVAGAASKRVKYGVDGRWAARNINVVLQTL